MLRTTQIYRLSITIFALLASTAFSGCATFDLNGLSLFARKEQPVLQAPQGTYTIELHEIGKKARRIQAPINGPIVVQDVLDRAGASKKFRNMKIELVRSTSELGQPHKMRIDYERANKRVSFETDYAIHDTDRIVVKEISKTSLDNMFEAALSPLSFVH